jgi:adenosylcobinamide-GDP ribazoletransferase
MVLFAQFQLAVMLLTRLPAGYLAKPPPMGQSVWAFPIVGLLVGTIGAVVATVLGAIDPILAAGVTVAALVLVTGGLHEDGLADLADGFGGGRDKAHKLEIMRDSRIGSYGTLALILILGLRVQALVAVQDMAILGLIAIEAASRAGLPLVMRVMPAARLDGLGQAAAAAVGMGRALVALCIGIAALMILGPTTGLILAAAIGLVVALVAVFALRQIGGQTGDVLGAMQQLSAVAAWLALSWLS